MKKIVKLWKRLGSRRHHGYYHHQQFLTDELERELMKAYMGTGVRGRRF